MDNSLVGKNLGPYEILSVLGRGPNSTVYRAYDTAQDRTVAIKVLPQEFLEDEAFLERFEKDISRLADLSHPHILPLYDAGQADGYPYLVMRYTGGGTLGDMLARYGELNLPDVVPTIQQIASALDHAHKRGIIHRFIKPSNILLDYQGNSYITDFGIAPVREAIVTASQSGILSGAGYVSPEVISAAKRITGAADVYSLGVILFELLTGQLPFSGANAADTARQHMTSLPPAPRSINERIPVAVERVMLKALAKDPRDRYATAGAMAQALSEAAGITTSAVRDTMPPDEGSGVFGRPPVPMLPPRAPGESITPPMGTKKSIEQEPVTPAPGSLKALDAETAGRPPPAPDEGPITPPPILPPVMPTSGAGGASGAGGTPPPGGSTPGSGTPISWKDLPPRERKRLQRERRKARRELQRQLGMETRWYTSLMAVLLVMFAWFVIGVLMGYQMREQDRDRNIAAFNVQPTSTADLVAVAETATVAAQTPTLTPVIMPSSTPTLTATATPTSTSTITPTVTPTQIGGSQGMVAFISERDGEPELYILHIASKQLTQLTQNNSTEGWPTWSPDGTLIAFYSSETPQGQHIYVINPLSFERTELTRGIRVDSSPIWSPDGSQIAFHSYDSNRSFIRTVTLDREEETLVQIPVGENRLFDWSTQEDILTYFGYSTQGSLEILRLDMNRDTRTPITSANGNVEFISYSPDRSQILFTNFVGGRRQIFIADNSPICAVITNCNTQRVTQDTSNWTRPRFSPDGTEILTASDRLGNLDLYILTLAGEIVQQLTDSPANDYDGVWQPVGGGE